MFFTSDRILVTATEADLKDSGFNPANVHWLLNGRENEIERINTEDKLIMLRRCGLQPVWLKFEFAKVTKRLINGQWSYKF